MGKIIVSIHITADGSVNSQHALNIDAEYFEFTQGLMDESQAVAFGRNTFELFQRIWPARLEDTDTPEWRLKMAQTLNSITKQVYSSNLKSTNWNNSEIIKTIDEEAITKFKKADQKGLLIFGSPGLVAAFAEKGLIDEYYFCINSLISGDTGLRLFDKIKLDNVQPLKLLSVKTFESGMVILHYQYSGHS
jgi:dihydrofolate reductase